MTHSSMAGTNKVKLKTMIDVLFRQLRNRAPHGNPVYCERVKDNSVLALAQTK